MHLFGFSTGKKCTKYGIPARWPLTFSVAKYALMLALNGASCRGWGLSHNFNGKLPREISGVSNTDCIKK